MKFLELADCFEKLEATTKRLEMFDLLGDLFKRASKEEIDRIVYFCEEQLLPAFKRLKIGMAEKLVERSIAKACNLSMEEVEKEYKKLGNLGLVVQKFLHGEGAELSVDQVYQRLCKIARTTGEGSVEKKIDLLARLICDCSPKEANYVVRFVLGRLRLGVGDPTIMDSLSKAIAGDRRLRPEIERAYNLCSDLGLVAEVLFEKGIDGIKEIKIRVGNPIRMALAERLPSAEEIIKKIGKCSVEAKYDGLRFQVHKLGNRVEIFSRNLERTTHMFPDIVEGTKKQIKAKEAILEGEALAFNEDTGEFFPFQITVQRKRKYKVGEMAKEFPLILFAFDLLYLNGKDLTQEGYEKRRRALARIIRPGFTIRLADRIVTSDPKEVEKYFEENIEKGLEGVLAKRLDSPYQAGARNFNWIKLKRSYKGELTDTIDVVIVGYFKGRGMRARWGIGALLGAIYDKKKDLFKTITKIGSGLTEENWKRIREILDRDKLDHKPARVISLIKPDVWVEPKYVFTVMADEITKSPLHTCGMRKPGERGEIGYALRFPRIQGWIRDKLPEDANSEEEILEMFRMQKKVRAKSFAK